MIKIIQFLWSGCWHDWQFLSVNRLAGDGGAVGQRVTSKCTKCGKHRKQDLI